MEYPVLGDGRTRRADGTRLRQGGCLCGQVRFDCLGEPAAIGLCHCLECRKATGAPFMAYADWPPARFSYRGRIDTVSGRSFCPQCGTRVFHLSDRGAEVLLGALDEAPGDLVPTVEGWTIRRAPWLAPVPGARQFERDIRHV
jgi:hypothetical protein